MSSAVKAQNLSQNPIHLGLGAKSTPQPDFNGMPWYEAYTQRTASDGNEGRLVAMHTFSTSWDMWEMHPNGSEVVICTAGQITLIQELNDNAVSVTLKAGEYVINPPGVWHTADVKESATALFITSGIGTQHRPR